MPGASIQRTHATWSRSRGFNQRYRQEGRLSFHICVSHPRQEVVRRAFVELLIVYLGYDLSATKEGFRNTYRGNIRHRNDPLPQATCDVVADANSRYTSYLQAQQQTSPLTTADKIREKADTVYVMCDGSGKTMQGFLRLGRKHLFLYPVSDMTNRMYIFCASFLPFTTAVWYKLFIYFVAGTHGLHNMRALGVTFDIYRQICQECSILLGGVRIFGSLLL